MTILTANVHINILKVYQMFLGMENYRLLPPSEHILRKVLSHRSGRGRRHLT